MRFACIPALSLFGSALAAPAILAPRQDNPSVTFCDGISFAPPCAVAGVPLKSCVNVPSDYVDKISSFRPSSGLACLLYSDNDCQGSNPGAYFVSPGSDDLRKQNFNDIANSFQCKSA
ncbi:hypothetical protein FS749_014304 [Ceratobasidium sp. UAMH 11750]|nr:hypothetical protein FS749_014304 [Ceratobasidium sp. UAMH 11750]